MTTAAARNVGSARELLARAAHAERAVTDLVRIMDEVPRGVVAAFDKVRERKVSAELSSIPVERIRDATGGRLRLGPMPGYGIRTVADVLSAGRRRLLAIPGVGENTADKAYAAAKQIRQAVRESIRFRIDLDPADADTTALLQHLWVWAVIRPIAESVPPEVMHLAPALAHHRVLAAPAMAGSFRRIFTAPAKKTAATAAMARIAELLSWADHNRVATACASALAAPRAAPPAAQLWHDFERRSADYYGLLGGLVDLGQDVEAAEGFLPREIVERINAQILDDTRLRVSLRGYQAFGARFALVQRRVIIGDEMGLGKTIQAIAVLGHLAASGATHFLVVCPASVLINWMREVTQRSDLRVVELYGPDRIRAAKRWTEHGGVAVTTFESLSALDLNAVTPSVLVVDEAHYVKNKAAKRSKAVASLAARCERVLFLTGTPMENRVEEFRSLTSYLQPQVAQRIGARDTVAGPKAFRQAVAPAYLRRNVDDVLVELPELIQVEEWEKFGAEDGAAYRSAVAQGNFMAMRRAAFEVSRPQSSAKLARLLEIADEAMDNGHKVVVFSYFRDVLAKVTEALGLRAHGPITGSLAAAARQHLVDEFTDSAQPAVLVSQIQAGGVGLNIQAASVVILCEPQVKPSTEVQAIARAYRMGQVRNVQVHRLLIADSVDQRMLEILGSKAQLFNAYVRTSAVADAAPEAVDISEAQLAKMIVEQEQERMALEAMAAFQPPSPTP